MSTNRGWMYTMRSTNGILNPAFQQIVTYFLDFAYKHAKNINEQTIEGVQVSSIRCPCCKCKNRFYKTREEVERHLITKGFMKNYELWYAHGESHPIQDTGQCSNHVPSQIVDQDADEDLGEYTGHDQMVIDGMHQNHNPYYQQGPQDPNRTAQAFYNMLEQANEPLWEGSKDASTLSITTRLLNWKSDEITDDDDDDDDDDAYNDSEYDVDHPSRQNSFNRDVPRETSGKQFIERIGDKFADHDIHSKICDILLEHYDGPWATFRKVPKDVVISMFARFGTLYCWDPENEQLIYDAFRNVIKDRFRDIMSEWRVKSKKKAKDAGHVIRDKEHKFDIICSFPPDSVSSDVWQQLCLGWNTEKWLNKSASGRKNRTKEGTGGGISRHTGGSIGFDERRIRLEKKHGRKVKWIEVFFDTHLTKESKKKYWAGELNINSLEGFEFCTEQSKQAFVKYKSDMIKLHGPDLNQHPDDLDVWEKVAKRSRRRMFGIGSSDPHFVVTGKPSTFSRSTSYFGVIRSQEEVQKVRAEMETQLEDERKSRNELEERVQRMEQLEKERMKNEEMRQKQFEELMKKFQPSRSN